MSDRPIPPTPGRRRILGAAASIGGTFLAGCLAGGSERGPGRETDRGPPVRIGGAPPETIEAEPTGDYEVLPGGDTVRVSFRSGEREVSFDAFGTVETGEAALDHVTSVLRERGVAERDVSVRFGIVEDAELEGVAGNPPPDPSEFDRTRPVGISVAHVTRYSRADELVFEPEIPFGDLVPLTPRSVSVALVGLERSFSTVLPVLCERRTAHEQ